MQSSLFRHACYVIKFWAKQKGIYSSKFHFIGGICYTVMVGEIVLKNKCGSIEQVLELFFEKYSKINFQKTVINMLEEHKLILFQWAMVT